MTNHTYNDAGVDLGAGAEIKARIKNIGSATHGVEVLDGVGGFGGLYQLSGYRQPVLVSSTDGVGTKLKIAAMMDSYGTIGEDLVNACVNDVVVCGATPLFFLDYIAIGKLVPEVVEALLEGMIRACNDVGCALIGGETAQMPGLYAEGEFDLAGFVVGAVERDALPDHSSIIAGDVLLGVPSNGLHTNGYSLVRHALGLEDDPSPLWEFHPKLGQTLGEALLVPHRSYYRSISPLFHLLKGMAHITGGGLVDNVSRVLPEHLAAQFDATTWSKPPIYSVLSELTSISDEEMYRVFNMGLGIVLICEKSRVEEISALTPEARVVGEVVSVAGMHGASFQ